MKRIPYASGVGSLMYAMVYCRPDLAHAVSQVSRFMANPGKEHWRALKGVFRYLVGIVGVGICYGQEGSKEKNSNMIKENQSRMIDFVDADYGGDMDTRRSTTGYVFCLNRGPVHGDQACNQSRHCLQRKRSILASQKLPRKLYG